MTELTKVSSKGQVVIPADIREDLEIKAGTSLVVSRINGLILMKKLTIPDPRKEFERLTKLGSTWAKKHGIKSEEDIVKKIHKARGIK